VTIGPDELRSRFLEQIAPVLADAGVAGELGLELERLEPGGRGSTGRVGRRSPQRRGGPDAETLSRVRGDKNRAMLLD
jgi:hypothetical protein